MGSAAFNSQYSFLREFQQSNTNRPDEMASDMTKGKAPATSVYPSPADEINHTFHEQSSPVFNEQQVAPSVRREKITLPPITSFIHQMPSPSSSPQLAVAHYRSPTDVHLMLPNEFSRITNDQQLFPDRPATSDEVARPRFLFGGPVQPIILSERDQQLFAPSSQSSIGGLPRPVPIEPSVQCEPIEQARSQYGPAKNNFNALNGAKNSSSGRLAYAPGRKPKQIQTGYDIHMRRPISPSAPRYGRNDLWARQAADPSRYVENGSNTSRL
jgi:hypothetical protein